MNRQSETEKVIQVLYDMAYEIDCLDGCQCQECREWMNAWARESTKHERLLSTQLYLPAGRSSHYEALAHNLEQAYKKVSRNWKRVK